MLRINQTDGQIGVETKKAQMHIQTKAAKINIHQDFGAVEQRSELPKVLIDQYQCRAESGLKNNIDFSLAATQFAKQNAMEYISKVVDDGNRLAMIENPSNPIPDFVERDAYPEHEFGMVTMPTSRPKIDVTGSLHFNVRRAKANIECEPGTFDMRVTPHEVNIFLKQKPSITIEYIGENIDTKI